MKDYYNSAEINQLLKVGKLIDEIEVMLNSWNERKNLTKEEHKALKFVLTYGCKAWKSFLQRTNCASLEQIDKRRQELYIQFIDKWEVKNMKRNINKDVDKAFDAREEYYNLVEKVLDKNCKNCTCDGSQCGFYKHFTENIVPEPVMEHFKDKHCKYAYRLEDRK